MIVCFWSSGQTRKPRLFFAVRPYALSILHLWRSAKCFFTSSTLWKPSRSAKDWRIHLRCYHRGPGLDFALSRSGNIRYFPPPSLPYIRGTEGNTRRRDKNRSSLERWRSIHVGRKGTIVLAKTCNYYLHCCSKKFLKGARENGDYFIRVRMISSGVVSITLSCSRPALLAVWRRKENH